MCPRFASRPLLAGIFSLALGASSASLASAAVTEFSRDLSGFTVAAGSSAVSVDFDGVAPGTDIGGQTIGGATFTAVGSPLLVVNGDGTTTVGTFQGPLNGTNHLIATSGANVVSPGGAELPPGLDINTENDDLQITFANPVGYFGLDHLAQQADGTGYTAVEVVDAQNHDLFNGVIKISLLPAGEDGIVPGGSDFWGVVSDSNNIAKVILNDRDDNANAPDNNVGYDSLRFGALAVTPPPPASIPLPAAVTTFPFAAAAAAIAARHFRRG